MVTGHGQRGELLDVLVEGGHLSRGKPSRGNIANIAKHMKPFDLFVFVEVEAEMHRLRSSHSEVLHENRLRRRDGRGVGLSKK